MMIKKIELDINELNLDLDINKYLNEVNSFISSENNPVVLITGSTSSGKTKFAHLLKDNLNSFSQLISADSRQIYKDVNIGSNKPIIYDKNILDNFITSYISDQNKSYSYWNLDLLDLKDEYSAQKFREITRLQISTLHSYKSLPIIVGGSVHWLRSLISENISAYYESNSLLYLELNHKSLLELQTLYKEYYKDFSLNESDWNNPRRLMRAIEYAMISKSSIYKATIHIKDINNYLIFQTKINREQHRIKLKQSIETRISSGWINEVSNILNKYKDISLLDKLGLGYRIIGNFLINNNKKLNEDNKEIYNSNFINGLNKTILNNLIEEIVIAEMRYSKKQIL